jgi:hypothetical protein
MVIDGVDLLNGKAYCGNLPRICATSNFSVVGWELKRGLREPNKGRDLASALAIVIDSVSAAPTLKGTTT